MRLIALGALVLLCLAATTVVSALPAPEVGAPPSPPWESGAGSVSQGDLQTITTPAAPPTLTLQDALRLGFANNAGFRFSIASLLAAQGNLRATSQSYSLTLLGSTEKNHFSAGEDFTQTDAQALLGVELPFGTTISISALLNSLDGESTNALALSASQPLLRGAGSASSRYEALRQARSSYRGAVLSYFLARQDLALSIITGYFGVARTKQQVAIQEQGLARTEQAAKDAETRFTEGMTTKIEVARAQLSLASSRLALNSAKLSYLDAAERFLKTLGLTVGATPELTSWPLYKPAALDMDALTQEALRNRAEVVIADLGLEDAAAALRISRSNRRPALDLFGSTTSSTDGDSGADWTLGIQTTIPIGSRALTEAVRSAERGLLLAQRGRAELRQSITTEVGENVRGLQSQEERIVILQQSLDIAREKLRLATISVDEGIGVYRDKIEAQEQVTAAERDLLDAQIAYYFGVLGLRQAVGRDVLQGLEQEVAEAAAAGR